MRTLTQTHKISDRVTAIIRDRQEGKTQKIISEYFNKDSILLTHNFEHGKQVRKRLEERFEWFRASQVSSFRTYSPVGRQDKRIVIDDFDCILNGLTDDQVSSFMDYVIKHLKAIGQIVNGKTTRTYDPYGINFAHLFLMYKFPIELDTGVEIIVTATELLPSEFNRKINTIFASKIKPYIH